MRAKGEYRVSLDALAGAEPAGGTPRAPFDRPDWYAMLARDCFGDSETWAAQGMSGDTRALLPLRTTAPGHAAALAHWYSFAWRPLFSGDGDAESDALTAALRLLRHDATSLKMQAVPQRDGTYALLTAALRRAGWAVFATPHTQNHWLDVAGQDFAAYWASRPGALRNTHARKAKKNIVALQLIDHFDADAWSAYEAIYAQSWKPAEGNPDFLRAFAMAEGAAGRIRFGLATIEGQPVAAQFWTVENGVAYIHKLAHVEDSLKASPGTLLTYALFARVIDGDGVREVNFGTGNDAYKRDWMNRCDPLWRIDAYNPARIAAWPAIARAQLSQWRRKTSP